MVEIRGKLPQITRLAVLAIFLLTAGCAHSPSPNTLLKFDPEVEKIQLKNGMEVWLRSTKTPKNEVHFLLRFEVGSVHERYSESGVAHLLEHLAFNGSKHFLKGTLDNQFKRHGLSLGTHQNASTGYFDTTYKLIIPPKKAVLRDTMLFFSDIAQNLTLSPSAVEQEKSVVLAETTTRSGLGERTAKRQIEFLFPGSRIAKRPIDGNERIIRKLDAASIKAFYRRWYRPDRTKLIIVGDIDNIRPYLVGLISIGRTEADEGFAAGGQISPTGKLQLPAGATNVAVAGRFGAYLSLQVYLKGTVYGYLLPIPGDNIRVMGVIDRKPG